jgi:hypothetical protein
MEGLVRLGFASWKKTALIMLGYDGYLDRLPFAHVEGVTSVLTMANAPSKTQTSDHN